MTRTLATISTEKGIARITHDDQTSALEAFYADGSVEQVGDYYPTSAWRKARMQVIAMYGCTSAHDSWVLCLRPLRALRIATTEEHAEVL